MEYISGRLMRPVFCIMTETPHALPPLNRLFGHRAWGLLWSTRYFLRCDTMLNVSWAIVNSSLVGITMILTWGIVTEMKRFAVVIAAVLLLVKDNSQRLQTCEHDASHCGRSFRRRRGKHDSIAAGHFNEILTEVFTNGVRVHLVGEHCTLIAFFRRPLRTSRISLLMPETPNRPDFLFMSSLI